LWFHFRVNVVSVSVHVVMNRLVDVDVRGSSVCRCCCNVVFVDNHHCR